MDKQDLFTGPSEFYHDFRPRYPDSVIQVLQDKIHFTKEWEVADVGAGTGILSELFVQNGNHVFCVEPNIAMIKKAKENRFIAGKVNFVCGTGEFTNLPEASVDIVACGQSFHWINPDAAKDEFSRILRGEKWVLLMWNDRRNLPMTFTGEYERIVKKYSANYHSTGSTVVKQEIFRSFFSGSYEMIQLPNSQLLDLHAVIGRYMSASYAIKKEDPVFGDLVREFSEAFGKFEHNGYVSMEYVTTLYLGKIQ